MVSQSSTSLICTVPEMCRRYIWALTRPPCPPFDVAHVESDSECLWCHRAMWCVHEVCHVPSLMAHPHLAFMFSCKALATATSRRKAFCSSATTQQKRPNMETLCFTPHRLAILRRQRTSSWRRTAFARCQQHSRNFQNAPMMRLKIFKYGWLQTPRDCHRLEVILHILDHKSKLSLSFLPQSCPSLTFTDRTGPSRFLFCVPTLEWFGLKLVQTWSVVTKFSSAICVLFMFGCWA